MWKRSQKILSMVCVVVLCLLLAACGNNEPDKKPGGSTKKPTTTTTTTAPVPSDDADSTPDSDPEPSEEPDTPDAPDTDPVSTKRTYAPTRTKPRPTTTTVVGDTPLTVYIHNVCSHGDAGSSGGLGSNSGRLPAIKAQLKENDPDVVVLAECNMSWAKSIAASTGLQRAENQRTGQSEVQVFYKADKFTLLENSVENETRSAYHWVVLQVKATGQKFLLYGFHGDLNPAERLAETQAMAALGDSKGLPAIYMGDFNFERDCDEYRVMTAQNDEAALTAASRFDMPTCPGWSQDGQSYIDHIFYTKGKFTANSYTVLDQNVDGVVLSDHCALVAKLTLKA